MSKIIIKIKPQWLLLTILSAFIPLSAATQQLSAPSLYTTASTTHSRMGFELPYYDEPTTRKALAGFLCIAAVGTLWQLWQCYPVFAPASDKPVSYWIVLLSPLCCGLWLLIAIKNGKKQNELSFEIPPRPLKNDKKQNELSFEILPRPLKNDKKKKEFIFKISLRPSKNGNNVVPEGSKQNGKSYKISLQPPKITILSIISAD